MQDVQLERNTQLRGGSIRLNSTPSFSSGSFAFSCCLFNRWSGAL